MLLFGKGAVKDVMLNVCFLVVKGDVKDVFVKGEATLFNNC